MRNYSSTRGHTRPGGGLTARRRTPTPPAARGGGRGTRGTVESDLDDTALLSAVEVGGGVVVAGQGRRPVPEGPVPEEAGRRPLPQPGRGLSPTPRRSSLKRPENGTPTSFVSGATRHAGRGRVEVGTREDQVREGEDVVSRSKTRSPRVTSGSPSVRTPTPSSSGTRQARTSGGEAGGPGAPTGRAGGGLRVALSSDFCESVVPRPLPLPPGPPRTRSSRVQGTPWRTD